MAQPKLRSPDQPLWLQAIFAVYEFCASLKLAVLLIFASVFVLAWATVVESHYGQTGVRYGMYGSWWFVFLCGALAVNIFCAAAIRFPWKRHQTGFVITHIGLLTLLFGAYLHFRDGIDAQIPIIEGGSNYLAYPDEHRVILQIQNADDPEQEPREVNLAFNGGPFNWDFYQLPVIPEGTDYVQMPYVGFTNIAFRMAERDAGPLHETGWVDRMLGQGGTLAEENITVEAIDFHSDARELSAPFVRVHVGIPKWFMRRQKARMRGRPTDDIKPPKHLSREYYEFSAMDLHAPSGKNAEWEHSRVRSGGGIMSFWTAKNSRETALFLAKPDEQVGLGENGQLVLRAKGKTYHFLVDDLEPGQRVPLGETGLEIELKHFLRSAAPSRASDFDTLELQPSLRGDGVDRPGVEVFVHNGEQETATIALLADLPQVGQQAQQLGVYGSYWYDHKAESGAERMQGRSGSRLDFLQGHDLKLYYRYWNGKKVVASGKMPTDGTLVTGFRMSDAATKIFVDKGDFIPSREPKLIPRPEPFNKDLPASAKRPAVKLRITVHDPQTGKATDVEEVWVVGIGLLDDLFEQIKGINPQLHQMALSQDRIREVSPLQNPVIEVGGKRISLQFLTDVVSVGCNVHLDQFERKLDPGTSQPSHYGSQVDFVKMDEEGSYIKQDVRIVMNAPVDVVDPTTGRRFRLFQESFRGPYEDVTAPKTAGGESPERFVSILTLNYDPGRGIRSVGCLLVVAGIATMFYMRAYFFKPAGRQARSSDINEESANAEHRAEPAATGAIP